MRNLPSLPQGRIEVFVDYLSDLRETLPELSTPPLLPTEPPPLDEDGGSDAGADVGESNAELEQMKRDVRNLKSQVRKPKSQTKKTRDQRNKFSRPRRKKGNTWPQIYEEYSHRFPQDTTASQGTLRLS